MERSHRRWPRACCRVRAAPRDRAAGWVLLQVLLTLGAVTLWVLLFAAFSAVAGCASRPHAWIVPAEPRASLIFPADPSLTPIPAEEIVRADWPIAAGRTSYGYTTDYHEYWYDAQGLGQYDIDYGYRTFTLSRTGQQSGQ